MNHYLLKNTWHEGSGAVHRFQLKACHCHGNTRQDNVDLLLNKGNHFLYYQHTSVLTYCSGCTDKVGKLRSMYHGINTRLVSPSVTRFGEISPLWKKFTSLWKIFDSLFLIWQNAEPYFAKLWHYWANCHWCNWPIIEKLSNHLVTLVSPYIWYLHLVRASKK